MQTIFATQFYGITPLFSLYDFTSLQVGIWTDIPMATTNWIEL
jgi:hypothetical protein